MPSLGVNFKDVGTFIPPVTPEEYEFEIVGTPEIKATKKDPSKNMLVVIMRIIGETEFAGRQIYDYIMLAGDMGLVRLKRLILSCGLDGDGELETEEFAGCTGSPHVA